MAKKGLKSKKSGKKAQAQVPPNSVASQKPVKTKKKKAFVIREEHPGMVLPIIAIAVVLGAVGLGDKYDVLNRALALWIGGGVAVLFGLFAPILYNKNYLYVSGFKPLLLIMAILTLIGCGGGIWFSSWSQPAVFKGVFDLTDPVAKSDLSSGPYGVLIQGFFDEEAAFKDDKKAKFKNVSGTYKLSLGQLSSTGDPKNFEGYFEHSYKRRKLSKKARGYQEIAKTKDFKQFWISKTGPAEIRLSDISGDLSRKMEISVYKSSILVYFLMVFGIIPFAIASYMDHVIRSSRIASLFGVGVGACFGFVVYFYFESSPIVRFPTMAIDMFIGGLVGILASFGLSVVLKGWFASLALKKGTSL